MNNGLLTSVEKLIKKTGKFQNENFGKQIVRSWKSRYDVVTDIDLKSEELLIDGLKSIIDIAVISEETDPEEKKNESEVWIIDPLDGTTNYSHGYPFFCISVALYSEGSVKCGFVYAPWLDEMFVSDSVNSWLNGAKIKVSDTEVLAESLIATGFPYDRKESSRNNISTFSRILPEVHGIRRDGAAALDLCYTAAGRFDGYWELKLKPWDVAAGSIILESAGGRIRNYSNSGWNVFDDTVIAANPKIFDNLTSIVLNGNQEDL